VSEAKPKRPFWWDQSKLARAYFAPGYSGWIINYGDGTCRYANQPLLGADPGLQEDGSTLTQEQCDAINAAAPNWGDLVRMSNGMPDPKQILERYDQKIDKSVPVPSGNVCSKRDDKDAVTPSVRPPSVECDYAESKQRVDILKKLLDDPHPGLMSWHMAYTEQVQWLVKFWGYER